MDIVIKNGTVINAGSMFRADVGIRNGKIVALAEDLSGQENIDASGKYILPGLIESHAYLESPFGSTRSVDNFFRGTQAAASGGITTLIDRVVPMPDEDLQEAIRNRRDLAEPQVAIDYSLHICINRLDEQVLEQIPQLVDQGYPSFEAAMYDLDARQALSDSALIQLMKTLQSSNSLLLLHCGNQALLTHLRRQYPLNSDQEAIPHYAEVWPAEAESMGVLKALSLARHFETPLFLHNLSTAEAVQTLSQYHHLASRVHASCSLHHLTHTAAVYAEKEGRNYTCMPPLRSERDRQFLLNHLGTGPIQVVSSSHRSFTQAQKKLGSDMPSIPAGFANLGALLPVMHQQGVGHKHLNLMQLVGLLSAAPAQIFGLSSKGSVAIGKDADLVIFDPKERLNLSSAQMHTESDISLYDQEDVQGSVEMTLSRGKIVFESGRFVGEQGAGQFVARRL